MSHPDRLAAVTLTLQQHALLDVIRQRRELAGDWDESKHPREGAGTPEGGRFAPAGGGGEGASQPGPAPQADAAVRTLPASMGFERKDLPQIRSFHQEEFKDWVRAQGIAVTNENVPVASLTPAQRHYNQTEVSKLTSVDLYKPLMISSDNVLLDGHHRWVRQMQDDPAQSVPVVRIGQTATEALATMRAFPKVEVRDISAAPPPAPAPALASFSPHTPTDETLPGARPLTPLGVSPSPETLAWLEKIEQNLDVAKALEMEKTGTQTVSIYTDKNGRYTPERQAVHLAIAEKMLKPTAAVPVGPSPVAVLMIGKGGAGKTTTLKSILPDQSKFDEISADDAKEQLPDYTGYNSGLVHEESTNVAENIALGLSIDRRHNFIFDATGKTSSKYEGYVRKLVALGYQVVAVHVDVPTAVSAERVVSRFLGMKTARENDPSKPPPRFSNPRRVLFDTDGKPSLTYSNLKAQGLLTRAMEFDNSGPPGTTRKVEDVEYPHRATVSAPGRDDAARGAHGGRDRPDAGSRLAEGGTQSPAAATERPVWLDHAFHGASSLSDVERLAAQPPDPAQDGKFQRDETLPEPSTPCKPVTTSKGHICTTKGHGFHRVYPPDRRFPVTNSTGGGSASEHALFDPDQPRDEQGQWTIGGGGSGAGTVVQSPQDREAGVLFSPNIEEHLTFETAAKRLFTSNQVHFKSLAQDIDTGIGLHATQHSAIGDWSDGAENSIFTEIQDAPDFETVRYSAAWKGKLANQKAVIPFMEQPDGPDSLYTMTVPRTRGGMNAIRKSLDSLGLTFRTLIPEKDATQVVIFRKADWDNEGTIPKAVEAMATHFDQIVTEHVGKGDYLGSDTSRAAGLKIFTDSIKAFEQSHSARYAPAGPRVYPAGRPAPESAGEKVAHDVLGSLEELGKQQISALAKMLLVNTLGQERATRAMDRVASELTRPPKKRAIRKTVMRDAVGLITHVLEEEIDP